MDKSVRIVRLDIDEHDDFSGVDAIALVEEPAIEADFMYFAKQQPHAFESYSDYPDAVSNNAKRGIELNEKVNNKCATQVGKVRAQQLAKKEPISVETIKRMYSYLSRAEEYYDENDTEACGTISYLLWGGLAAKRWSEAKLKELGLFEGNVDVSPFRAEDYDIDVSGLAPYINEPSGSLITKLVENAGGFSVGDYVSWTFAGRGDDADRGRGQIIDLRVQGDVNVPETDVTLTATEEEPVALIRTRSGKVVGQYTRNLRKIQKPEGFVTPSPGESEDDFISRCIPVLIGEGKDGDQAAAICYSYWRDRFENDKEIERVLYSYVSGLFDLLGFLDGLPVFATPAEAEEVAQVAGCEGYHEHQMGDYVVYMPCYEHEEAWDSILKESYDEWVMSNTKSWKDLSDEELDSVMEYLESVAEDDVMFSQETFAIGKIEGGETRRSVANTTSFLDTQTTKTRYRYNVNPTAPPNKSGQSRDFCQRLMTNFTARGKVFRKEDINNMSLAGVNRGFGPNGIDQYNIFLYRGGNNCRHVWEEVVYTIEDGKAKDTTKKVGTIADLIKPRVPATPLEGVINPLGIGTSFSKQEFADKQIVAGPLMIPNKLIYRYDETNGEYFVYFSEETIEKIAYKYMQRKYTDNTNLEHSEELSLNDVFVVESWIISDPNRDKSLVYSNGEKYPKGTWYGMVKVKNKEIWDDYVKTGLVKGFSVEGFFIDELLNRTEKDSFQ